MKKKHIIFFIVGLILVTLLFPIRNTLKDGGTITYKSLTYKITKYHKLDDKYEGEYKTGAKVELFGFTLYEKINSKKKDYNELIIYEMENGLPHCHKSSCLKSNKIFAKIKVETEDAKVLDVSEHAKYILIDDGKTKLYNSETEELTNLNLEPNYIEYIFQTIGENEKLIGISYYKTMKDDLYYDAGFYNTTTNQKMYEGGYRVIKVIDENTLKASTSEEKIFILDANEERIIKEEIKDNEEFKGTIN